MTEQDPEYPPGMRERLVAAAKSIEPRRLTPRQSEILGLIRGFILDHGYPPSMRELGSLAGINSTNCVCEHLRYLRMKGWLLPSEARARMSARPRATPAKSNEGYGFIVVPRRRNGRDTFL